jgi:hypothetical protein
MRVAFVLGYTVEIVGIHFRVADLLAEAEKTPEPALRERVAREWEQVKKRGPNSVANVRRAEALVGGAPPPAPRSGPEYDAWEKAMIARAPAGAGFEIGRRVGDAMQTLNLQWLAETLRALAPSSKWLADQCARLAELRLAAAAALGEVASSADGEARATTERLALVLRGPGGVPPSAADAQAAITAAAAMIPALEKALPE